MFSRLSWLEVGTGVALVWLAYELAELAPAASYTSVQSHLLAIVFLGVCSGFLLKGIRHLSANLVPVTLIESFNLLAARLEGSTKFRELWGPGVLLIFTMVHFSPVFLNGLTLSPLGFLHIWPPFNSYGGHLIYGNNDITSDYADSLFPYYFGVYQAFVNGEAFPLNFRFNLSVDNNATLLQTHYWSIDGFLVRLLTPAWGLTVAPILRCFLGSLFTYAFLRLRGVSSFGATVAGLVFSFSAFGVVHTWLPFMFNIPMMFLALELFMRKATFMRFLFVVVAVISTFCAGQIVWSIHVFAITAIYFFTIQLVEHRNNLEVFLTRTLFLFLAGLVALLLLAPLVLPSFEHKDFLSLDYRKASSFYYHSHPFSVMFLYPLISGTFFAGFKWGGNIVEYSYYVGITSILLCLFAVRAIFDRASKTRTTALFCILLFLFLYFVVTNTFSILELVQKVPFFDSSSNTRLRFQWGFPLAILAGLGADFLMNRIRCIRSTDLCSKTICYLFAALVLSVPLILPANPFFIDYQDLLVREDLLQQPLIIFLMVVIVFSFLGGEKLNKKPGVLQPWFTTPFKKGLLLCLVFFDLHSTYSIYHMFIPEKASFPQMRVTDFLKENLGLGERVMPIQRAFISNFNLPYGISSVQPRGFYTHEQRTFFQLIDNNALAHHPTMHFFGLTDVDYNSRLIDLLNVKYLLFMPRVASEQFLESLKPKWKQVYQDELLVLENQGNHQSGYFTTKAQVIDDAASRLSALRKFEPEDKVILSSATDLWKSQKITYDGLPAEIAITKNANNEAVFEINTVSDGYLVFSKFYHPAWKAYAGGEPVKTFVANHVFVGARVPAGTREVSFRFEPENYRVGKQIALYTAFSLLALFLASRRYRW